jgi:hypothetical protein
VGNLLHCLGSKAIKRALERTQPLSETAVSSLKDALHVAKETSVEIPAAVQALATTFIS